MDSFKGSLSSLEAGEAIAQGALRALPGVEAVVRPLADGGEGTVEALVAGMQGTPQRVTVTGPMGTPVDCTYGILPDGRTAVLEMAGAAGLPMVAPEQRDPLRATTYGVGEVIRDAIGKGCRRFIVGIGGSATNDGGVGMLQALGYGFLDRTGQPIAWGAAGLAGLCTITTDQVMPELAECEFKVACDVTNPLCGAQGSSAVYGPQKGATPETIALMDSWLARYAELAARQFPGRADPERPGAGAAGGLGFAFLSFTRAELASGIQIVLEETRLADYLQDADLVVTGEGRLDGQTAMGKAPVGVAGLAKTYGKTCGGACRQCYRRCCRLQPQRHRCIFPHSAGDLYAGRSDGTRQRPPEPCRHGGAGVPPVVCGAAGCQKPVMAVIADGKSTESLNNKNRTDLDVRSVLFRCCEKNGFIKLNGGY